MADTERFLEILNQIPMFRSLKPRQLQRIANRFIERDYAADEEIVTQGQGGEGFFIVLSGSVIVELCRTDQTCVKLDELGPGEFFGELALLTDSTRAATVRTAEPTHCAGLTRWDFLSLLRDDADMAVTVLQQIASRFSRVLNTM